ncbi:MAG TPA: response regulator transcription factor [Chitinophagaceae bacterium]|nr:response regulator transcription factor [Chitinophagaceae bacterium]
MQENLIRLVIADDHTAVRQSFISILSLQPSFTFIFEAENGHELLNKVSVQQPDVILLDIKMPGINGIEALKTIHNQYPDIKVLVLSAFFDELYVARCLEYGINGYLTKSMDMEDIIKAIHLAYNNEVYVNNLLNNALLKKYLAKYKKSEKLLPVFSNEELQLLNLLKHEKTTEEISVLMSLSKRSIEIKRDKMREKAFVKTIGGLLLYAFKTGLID